MRPEPPNSTDFKGLLSELRDGFALYAPVLIAVDAPEQDVGESSIDRTLSLSTPIHWHYGREYADHAYVLLGPNTLKSSLASPITIGRSRSCDVRVERNSVSKMHASVVFDRATGAYYLIDENSRNGTRVNGTPATPGARTPVWSGAYVSFGDAVFVFIDPPTLRKLSRLAR